MAAMVGDGLAVRLAELWLGYVQALVAEDGEGGVLPVGLDMRSFVSGAAAVRPSLVVGCDLDGDGGVRLQGGVVWFELRTELGPDMAADDASVPDEQTVLKWLEAVRGYLNDWERWVVYVQGLGVEVRRGFRVIRQVVGPVVNEEVDAEGGTRAPRVEMRVRVAV
jgi:hypothetical protein